VVYKNNITGGYSMAKNITKFKKVQALKSLFLDDKRCITGGKIYPVIRGGWRNIFIVDDMGDELKLYHDNISFRYMTN
jgi:hypothetical protein